MKMFICFYVPIKKDRWKQPSYHIIKILLGVGTHSSGNHGAGLARMASIMKIPAYIIMPRDAPISKKRAV